MRKSVRKAPRAGKQTLQKPRRTSSDIDAELKKSYCRTRSDVGRKGLMFYHAPFKEGHLAPSCCSKQLVRVFKKRRIDSGLYQAETRRQKICTVRLCIAIYRNIYTASHTIICSLASIKNNRALDMRYAFLNTFRHTPRPSSR
jgi:hypothetical protein